MVARTGPRMRGRSGRASEKNGARRRRFKVGGKTLFNAGRFDSMARDMTESATTAAPAEKQENLLLNLVCNVVLPSLILIKFSGPAKVLFWQSPGLGPVWALIVALAFPVGYGAYDLVVRRKWNFFSVVGFISTLLTGGLGLFEVAAIWIAVKEAAVPLVFGVAVVGSLWTATPLVRTLLYSDKILDTAKVAGVLAERGAQAAFEKLLVRATWLLAASFFLSAVTNFVLARVVLKSPPNTVEFKAEMGRMLALSWPVNVLPSLVVTLFALWYLLAGIRRLTGLTLDDVFRQPPEKK